MTDVSLYLIGTTSGQMDEFLQPIETETRTAIIGIAVPVSRAEFYAAGELGIRPDFEFVIHPAEYSGQTVVEVVDLETGKTERCRVYRTYRRTPDELELYCSRSAGLNEAPKPEPSPEPEPTPDTDDDQGRDGDDNVEI